MPPGDIQDLQTRFLLVEETYRRLGSKVDPMGKLDRLSAGLKSIFGCVKLPEPLPERMQYDVLLGKPAIKPKSITGNKTLMSAMKGTLEFTINKLMVGTTDQKEAAAKKSFESLKKALTTGDPNAYFSYYSTLTTGGAVTALPDDKTGNLSFYSGKTGTELAGKFANTTTGAKDTNVKSFDLNAQLGNALTVANSDAAFRQLYVQFLGIQSGLYAALAKGDVICFMPNGVSIGNIFWNNELPVLRRLQQEGTVDHIYVYLESAAPPGVSEANRSDEERMSLWFDKCVALTSSRVTISKRQADGSWLRLQGVTGDTFFKFVSTISTHKAYLILYRYRLETGIWCKLVKGSADDKYAIEMRHPTTGQSGKRIEVVGYSDIKVVLKKVLTLEKYLFANHPTWDSLPEPPESLVYSYDAILKSSKGRAPLLTMKHEGAWVYAPVIRTRIEKKVGPKTAGELIEGGANETDEAIAIRVAALHEALTGAPPPEFQKAAPVNGRVGKLIDQWEQLAQKNK